MSMLSRLSSSTSRTLDALSRSQALIEFQMDGTIVSANQNFLDAVGYRLDEIAGRHHSMFVEDAVRTSADYEAFWQALRRGEFRGGEFRRIGKGGREIWLQASYNPVLGAGGKPTKVVKIASDITELKRRLADFDGQLAAIDKSSAVIRFDLDGVILEANANFLAAVGYRLEEIKGQRHALFVEPTERTSDAYRALWDSLRRGEFRVGEFRRIGKGGREIWLQASYNPIFDASGKPVAVVKYATDITDAVKERDRRAAVGKQIEIDLGQISVAVSETRERVGRVVYASGETSSTVQTVAAGAEEMAASVQEINRQVAHALSTSTAAVEEAGRTSAIMAGLSDAARKIGDVVELIKDVADQTNLLALNATIEAARAGEAGRGFAIVASEVKNLAGQTARATDEIAAQIVAVQNSTRGAVSAIGSISGTISEINTISGGIAAAIEQQAAVTSEIAQSMQTAARGVETITDGMRSISAATEQIDSATLQVREASRSIA